MALPSLQAYDDLLRAFAEHVGLAGEALVRAQELVIDDVTIGLAYEGLEGFGTLEGFGDIMYFTDLGEPSGDSVPDIYRTLLQANHLWAGTGGATLGLQMDTGHIVLAGRIDFKDVTPGGLASLLDGFADTGQFWKKYVAGEIDLSEAPAVPFGMLV